MKKIIAFAGSNSSTSINQALVSHLASTIENCDVTVLELTDYPLPMYGQEIKNNILEIKNKVLKIILPKKLY